MTDQSPLGSRSAIRRYVLIGLVTVVVLVGGIGGGAAMLQLAGAVIASGQLVVDSNVKKVQHPTGGVVGQLNVRDGTRVKSGDLLVRLDDTVTRTNLAIVTKGLDELAAREARLDAEREEKTKFDFPDFLTARTSDPEVAALLAGEQKHFDLRRTQRLGQRSQLQERVAQLREEIRGMSTQAASKAREVELIQRELDGVRDLWKKRLVTMNRLSALERDAVRLNGERGQLLAQVSQAKGKITEIELQIIQIDKDLRSEVSKELREVYAKRAELVERKAAAEDMLRRIDIRAPQDGMVHQLSVFTVGGVINAGEQIMLIVPEGEALTLEAKVAPQDIDQVRSGQNAVVRFATFNRATTPELNGKVTVVSADLVQEQRTGNSYFVVRIGLTEEEVAKLGNVKLVPGMPAEVFIQTPSRSLFSYLIKPMEDQVMRAFRER